MDLMGKKLFVGNLSFDTTTADLEGLFSQAGSCESAAVITEAREREGGGGGGGGARRDRRGGGGSFGRGR